MYWCQCICNKRNSPTESPVGCTLKDRITARTARESASTLRFLGRFILGLQRLDNLVWLWHALSRRRRRRRLRPLTLGGRAGRPRRDRISGTAFHRDLLGVRGQQRLLVRHESLRREERDASLRHLTQSGVFLDLDQERVVEQMRLLEVPQVGLHGLVELDLLAIQARNVRVGITLLD